MKRSLAKRERTCEKENEVGEMVGSGDEGGGDMELRGWCIPIILADLVMADNDPVTAP